MPLLAMLLNNIMTYLPVGLYKYIYLYNGMLGIVRANINFRKSNKTLRAGCKHVVLRIDRREFTNTKKIMKTAF